MGERGYSKSRGFNFFSMEKKRETLIGSIIPFTPKNCGSSSESTVC